MRLLKAITTCVWYGESGTSYEYQIFSLERVFREVGGNYILCDRDMMGDWDPLFIGATKNFSACLGDPELQAWIRVQGVSHIDAHRSLSESQRRVESRDLLARFSPTLNRNLLW